MSTLSPTNTVDTGSGGTYVKDGFDQILAEVTAIYGHLNSALKLQTGDTAPATPATGELWVKTTGGASPILHRYSGSEWVQLGESGGFSTGVGIDSALNGYSHGMWLARASASSISIPATSTIMVDGKLLQNTSTTTLGSITAGDWDVYAERSGTTTNYVLGKVAHGNALASTQRLVGRVGRSASDVVKVSSVEPTADPTPVGALLAFAGSSAPAGWLLCDGSEYSTSAYAELYAVIADTYGSGTGTFMVPDLRTRVPAGYKSGDTDGFGTVGAEIGAVSQALPAHTHTIPYQTGAGSTKHTLMSIAQSDATDVTGSTGSGTDPISTIQPTLVVNYIIKY